MGIPIRSAAAAIGVWMAVVALAADDAPKGNDSPKSPQAVAAVQKHEKSVAKAREAMNKALIDAEQQLLRELDAAMATAMRNKAADEVVRITSAKTAAQAELKRLQEEAAGRAVGPDVRMLAGTWRVKFSNGNIRTYVIKPGGEVSFNETQVTPVLKPLEAGGWLLDFSDGKVEVLKVANDKLVLDHWDPASSYPDKPPRFTATCERMRER